jgi:hypothetical protein
MRGILGAPSHPKRSSASESKGRGV